MIILYHVIFFWYWDSLNSLDKFIFYLIVSKLKTIFKINCKILKK